MSFTLKSCLQRSFLTRLLQSTGLSLALMMASAIGVHAEDVTVQGAPGANGFDNYAPGANAGSGEAGGSVAASAGGLYPITSPLNNATAVGGIGGNGGNNYDVVSQFPGLAGNGGSGGDAEATAATTIVSGSAEADATSTGGLGGSSGENFNNAGFLSGGGTGGAATASAKGSTGSGNATTRATAKGGDGGFGVGAGGSGGDANASSTAITTAGSGDAVASANATGGATGSSFDEPNDSGGNATATADASAAGGGTATAKAVATGGQSSFPNIPTMAVATSTSNAKTSFEGVTVQSTATAQGETGLGPLVTATTEAIAQGGPGQTFVADGTAAIATALPDKAYATTLIDGASSVADALLGPRDEIFGTAILATAGEPGVLFPTASATFDFSFRGDLILGIIADGGFDIIANGIDILSESVGDNSVINLGSIFGPNIDLTIEGDGVFAFGGAVPEPSTWAMMLLGFAGLGFVGYRTNSRVNVRVV